MRFLMRFCAAFQGLMMVAYLVAGEWTLAFLTFLICAWSTAYIALERRYDELSRTRTVTTTLEVHQHPGESPEVFARRIADELARDSRRARRDAFDDR